VAENPRARIAALVTCATFVDIVAYSIAVPVLPDLSRRFGASPTVVGLLFASFGATLLSVSVPMGAVSDRLGRKRPLAAGVGTLAAATLLFAFATSLPWLFAARLVQGAADAVTWVVGFALIADLYDVNERGRVTGLVMMGTSFAVMIGPTLGGWLYDLGGIRLPFIAVAALAVVVFVLLVATPVPEQHAAGEIVPIRMVVSVPAIAACAAAVVAIAGTITMLEPVLSLHLGELNLTPGRIGTVYGLAAVVTTLLHPVCGRLSDRFGARRVTVAGLLLTALALPALTQAWSYRSAVFLYMLAASAGAFVITPSLAYMGEAASAAGVRSFGVSYGLYNLAWGIGLLGGPAIGGFLFERLGFSLAVVAWTPALAVAAVLVARVDSSAAALKEPL
jgi:DHA1 family solute carrier family 18 vesicular amine transporter 1/2